MYDISLINEIYLALVPTCYCRTTGHCPSPNPQLLPLFPEFMWVHQNSYWRRISFPLASCFLSCWGTSASITLVLSFHLSLSPFLLGLYAYVLCLYLKVSNILFILFSFCSFDLIILIHLFPSNWFYPFPAKIYCTPIVIFFTSVIVLYSFKISIWFFFYNLHHFAYIL